MTVLWILWGPFENKYTSDRAGPRLQQPVGVEVHQPHDDGREKEHGSEDSLYGPGVRRGEGWRRAAQALQEGGRQRQAFG